MGNGCASGAKRKGRDRKPKVFKKKFAEKLGHVERVEVQKTADCLNVCKRRLRKVNHAEKGKRKTRRAAESSSTTKKKRGTCLFKKIGTQACSNLKKGPVTSTPPSKKPR